MQEVLRKLEQVQEIDLQIHKIPAKKAEYPKRLEGYETEIKAHTAKYDEKKKAVDELEKGNVFKGEPWTPPQKPAAK